MKVALHTGGAMQISWYATRTQHVGLPLSQAYANLYTAPSPVCAAQPSVCCRHHGPHDTPQRDDAECVEGVTETNTKDDASCGCTDTHATSAVVVETAHDTHVGHTRPGKQGGDAEYDSELARVSAQHAARPYPTCSWRTGTDGASALRSIRAEQQASVCRTSESSLSLDETDELGRLRMRLLMNAAMRQARGLSRSSAMREADSIVM